MTYEKYLSFKSSYTVDWTSLITIIQPRYKYNGSVKQLHFVHVSSLNYLLLRPREQWRSIAMNTSVCVCLCVCLSASISPEAHARSLLKFLCMLPIAVARSSSGGVTKPHGEGAILGVFFPSDYALYGCMGRIAVWISLRRTDLAKIYLFTVM